MKQSKGYFRVYQTTVRIPEMLKVTLYLHALRDIKMVFRISSKYGANPKAELNVTNIKPLWHTRYFEKNWGITICPT